MSSQPSNNCGDLRFFFLNHVGPAICIIFTVMSYFDYMYMYMNTNKNLIMTTVELLSPI